MKKNILILAIICFLGNNVNAQRLSKLEKIQGKWTLSYNFEDGKKYLSDGKELSVIITNKWITQNMKSEIIHNTYFDTSAFHFYNGDGSNEIDDYTINDKNGDYLCYLDMKLCYEVNIDEHELSLTLVDRPSRILVYKRVTPMHKNAKRAIITILQSPIFSSPNIPTKMYLLKFDEVEVIAEKDNWLHIKYYGKKIVEGWIRKKDTELK